MELEKGRKLGPYEIIAPIGAGGMGEVYRAKDTRLDRTVAIKVLPSRTAMNEEVRARFDREAKAISSLNHPNICTLHDIGHQDGIDYLVMEMLEGEALDDRLKRGKIESKEALLIGVQIASALDTAHRKGLVHRDLKPSNVFLTKDGAKLLDFGLAKFQESGMTDMSDETRTTPVTGAGTIVGTLQYMAPEQLEGDEADARSDIFAFGATLYEMVTGQRAFFGESKASIIGSIMKEEPRAISEMMPTSPPALDRLIRKCLRKDPEERWQSARDLKDELDWIAQAGSQAGIPRPVASRRRFQLRLSWLLTIVFAVAAVVLGLMWLAQEKSVRQTIRFTLHGSDQTRNIDWPLISPDGQYLAYLGSDNLGKSQIWIHPLNSNESFPLPGTDSAGRPFWSPDSKYLAFFRQASGYLMKVPVSGGQPQIICKTVGTDGSWGKNDIIVFDDYDRDIGWVSASGGESKAAVTVDTSTGETILSWPCFLPDGEHFIYTASSDSLVNPSIEFLLKVKSIGEEKSKELGVVESRAVFCEPGYIVYLKNSFLVAHRFNINTLEFEGEPVPLTDVYSFCRNTNRGLNVSVSGNGILAFQKSENLLKRLVWVDRTGKVLDTVGAPDNYCELRLSPDNKRVAYGAIKQGNHTQVGIFDLQRKTLLWETSEDIEHYQPTWSPDGKRLAYSTMSSFDLNSRLMYRIVNQGLTVILKALNKTVLFPLQWTASDELYYGDYPVLVLPIGSRGDSISNSLIAVNVNDTSRARELYGSPKLELPYGFSPDGRYFLEGVYSGIRPGLYVYDMKDPSNKWQLPVFGSAAKWSPLGNEIFYFENDDLMALEVDLKDGFKFGYSKKLFTRQRYYGTAQEGTVWAYDVSSDGQKFLFIAYVNSEQKKQEEIEVVVDWQAELKEK